MNYIMMGRKRLMHENKRLTQTSCSSCLPQTFDNILDAHTQQEFERRLVSATGMKDAAELIATVQKNFMWQVNDNKALLPYRDYFVKRLLTWLLCVPTLFVGHFIPSQSKYYKVVERTVRVDWSLSATTFAWLFMNIPSVLYLAFSPGKSARVEQMIFSAYFTYIFILTLPYVFRETSYFCDEEVRKEKGESIQVQL
jgi:hypothetical protein